MPEADAFEALDPVEALERAGVLRADAVDQDLVELAQLARAGDRKSQHVPERKAEIVDQHLAARLWVPLGRVQRGQQIVDLAGGGVESDLVRQFLDQQVDPGEVLVDEFLGIGLQVLDLAGRGCGGENVSDQVADLAAVEVLMLPPTQGIEPAVERALETIDGERIEPGEAVLADQLVEPVLPLDQEMQAPLAILHVEREEILYPRGKMIRALDFEFERLAVG